MNCGASCGLRIRECRDSSRNFLIELVGRTGFEPVTNGLKGYVNPLEYQSSRSVYAPQFAPHPRIFSL